MNQNWEIKKLGELCEIKPPKKEARDKLKDTDLVTFLPMEDLGIISKNFIPTKERKLKDVTGSYTYFAENDVLLAKITPCFENGKIGIARYLTNGIGFGSSEYIVFRSKGEIISFWSSDGKPISAKEFLTNLFGSLPSFFKSEEELCNIWPNPMTRKALLEKLADAGYGRVKRK